MKALSAAKIFNRFCQFSLCQRTRGNDRNAIFRNFSHFFFRKCNQRMVLYDFSHGFRVSHTVDSQSSASWYRVVIGSIHDDRMKAAHFFLQQAYCICHGSRAKRIAADKFSKIAGMVRRCLLKGTHLYQFYRDSKFSKLKRSFAACKSGSYYGYFISQFISPVMFHLSMLFSLLPFFL